MKGRVVHPDRPRVRTGNHEADGPLSKGSEQFGVPFQEGPKVDRTGPRHQIDERVRAIPVDANGQLVREGAQRLGVLRAKDQRGQIVARDPMGEHEMRELVLLGREPRPPRIGEHGIEDHEPLDRRAATASVCDADCRARQSRHRAVCSGCERCGLGCGDKTGPWRSRGPAAGGRSRVIFRPWGIPAKVLYCRSTQTPACNITVTRKTAWRSVNPRVWAATASTRSSQVIGNSSAKSGSNGRPPRPLQPDRPHTVPAPQ